MTNSITPVLKGDIKINTNKESVFGELIKLLDNQINSVATPNFQINPIAFKDKVERKIRTIKSAGSESEGLKEDVENNNDEDLKEVVELDDSNNKELNNDFNKTDWEKGWEIGYKDGLEHKIATDWDFDLTPDLSPEGRLKMEIYPQEFYAELMDYHNKLDDLADKLSEVKVDDEELEKFEDIKEEFNNLINILYKKLSSYITWLSYYKHFDDDE